MLFGELVLVVLETFQNEMTNFSEGDGTPRFNPFFIPKMIADIAPGNISIKHGFMGANYTRQYLPVLPLPML